MYGRRTNVWNISAEQGIHDILEQLHSRSYQRRLCDCKYDYLCRFWICAFGYALRNVGNNQSFYIMIK